MALIFLDSSECSICKKVLKSEDDITSFASFLTKDHKWWEHSDCGMHTTCYNNWEHKKDFSELYEKVINS